MATASGATGLPQALISLEGGQLKSLSAAREVAKGLDLVESRWGIHKVRIAISDCFICADVDWRKLDRTPTERLIRDLIMQRELDKARVNPPPWHPPYWYVPPSDDLPVAGDVGLPLQRA